MITFIFGGIVLYVAIHLWAAIIPNLFARRLRKNKELRKAIQNLDDSYERMETLMDDFRKKYPDSCKSWEERDKENKEKSSGL
jgi:acyl carrier protein phosphodiesterase